MRVVVFLIYLCSLLSGGTHPLYRDTPGAMAASVQYLPKNQHLKFTNVITGSTEIEVADLDLEEEHPGNNEVKDRNPNKIPAGKYTLPGKWELASSDFFIFNYYHKQLKTSLRPLYSHSSPIYITQRALRI